MGRVLFVKDGSVPGPFDRALVEMCTMRILLAEDDPLVRESTRELLEILGYIVVAVEDGETALGLLSANHGFGLVVSDTSMRRGGMTGVGLLEEIRKSSSLPFVLMSALPDLRGLDFASFTARNRAVFIQKGALGIDDFERAIAAAVAISKP